MSVFIPPHMIWLPDAVVEATIRWNPKPIQEAGLTPEEARVLFANALAYSRVKADDAKRAVSTHRRIAPPWSDVLVKATDTDRKLARVSEQLVLLRDRGGTILPLLDDAWIRLRGMLATGTLVSCGLSEGVGKTRNLGAAYWSAPPADRAHAYGRVRFAFPPFGLAEEGPCVLVKAEFEALFDVSLAATDALSTTLKPQPPPAPAESVSIRSKPKREGVQRALAELYPAGVPDQVELPNHELLRAVAAKLGEKRVPSIETILRAAGRKEGSK